MNELLAKNQVISLVPQDFRNAVKGKVKDVSKKTFELDILREPKGILLNNLIEFYSQTKNGVLYFASDVVEIKGSVLKILNPIKHRYLQRRQFTRINFSQELELFYKDKKIHVHIKDLSAGGMKITSEENINLDLDYEMQLVLSEDQKIICLFEPIRIMKEDEGKYTLSGRFKNLSNIDRMTLIQFCIKKNMENVNK